MKRLKYFFKTRVSFSSEVSNHSFQLRCMPQENDCQTFTFEKCRVRPYCLLSRSEDCFGNIIHSGIITEPHDLFEYESLGEVILTDRYLLNEPLNRIYFYPSELTSIDGWLLELLHQTLPSANKISIEEKVSTLSEKVHLSLLYSPSYTNINTTAAEALALGRGVCQDYSHILIALCRASGIAARYVAGFYEGENYTHAWVEYYDDNNSKGVWRAIDPTNNRRIESGYIKVSHGRDYNDCSIERGIFTGIVQQQMTVELEVTG
ncbi:MAG: transglutaminase family protein [Tannerella sp.]|jgi:transglutaminase-like putative cysteine protease|nr:transglutaminase family protein [Tannerella sp.]